MPSVHYTISEACSCKTPLTSFMLCLQVLEPETSEEELADIGTLLNLIIHETDANRNFEFVQALLRVLLQVHGSTLMQDQHLHAKCKKLLQVLKGTWGQLDGLMQKVRCMVGFVGNLSA